MAVSGVKNPPQHDEWCHTHAQTVPFSYKWTVHINNMIYAEQAGEELNSTIFPVGSDKQVRLQLSMYPKRENNESNLYWGVFLNVVEANRPEVRIHFKISILNAKQNEIDTGNAKNTFSIGGGYGFPKFIKKTVSMCKSTLPDGGLMLLCEGNIILEETVNTSGKSKSVKFEVPECAALCELGQLLESCKLTDVTISACDEEIQAHKAILAAGSTVLATMIDSKMDLRSDASGLSKLEEEEQEEGKEEDSKMEEAKKNRIEIPDIEPKVIREMIRYIYTGKAPNLDKMADALIVAAQKFNLTRLKVMCAEALFKSLSTDNAADILILADQNSEEQLKIQAIDFINTNLKHVIDTIGFKRIADSYPYLLGEILSASIRM